ncbi:kinesin-domain-containing protein [Conidiobolus coronatus NRRL 28638]|uniref:Kinesin-domain-containing protein n=1 Tax=Conidiobolus coronatus (strain ATCC 28846 / CBS 209.66 / NRRL 28638) TaxID=796925 RepID=A0A137NV24_CONC2|nr:kinesin-domain-containing protein [Conidiobolus coronatus NRRL 28638]|eukprot:KXN66528.1 kinesin-domain-containing protein [Conidiobolus coronatus NRRL 28638]
MNNSKIKKSILSTTSTNLAINPNSSFDKINPPKEEVSFIKVVVRCRAANPLESYTGIGAKTEPRYGRNVEVQHRQAERGRKYTFNQVLGPDVSQEELFNNIMIPVVDEVLQGFNCTVFAYGQTGTGKTYTMEGQINQFSENLGELAGIIPRTLKHFFTYLEEQSLEYNMMISMMELYNEEVNDLLTTGDTKGLNLFQDPNKGLVIPELEEFSVTTVAEAMEKLRQGTNRRHIAATKINERSSRSHSIFTITIHTKQYSSDGEELLKVGKLNLVDLAGSENIGRSGSASENARKKETSSINTSLLTLGRVINALVSNEKHIPYRSSKLTRILQESLGGHAKTCIIATISPSRMNIEETIGTLDYVQKAMKICNKPEVNKVLTKKELIGEYVKQIANLKKQITIQMQKDGCARLSPEEYERLKDKESKYDQLAAKSKTESNELMASLQAQSKKLLAYENQLKHLMETLDHTKGRLKVMEVQKQEVENELKQTQHSLKEQTHLTECYTGSETNLNGIGKELVRQLDTSLLGIKSLNQRLTIKDGLIDKNQDLFQEFNNYLTQCSANLMDIVDSCNETSLSYGNQFKTLLASFQEGQNQLNGTLKSQLANKSGVIKGSIDELNHSQSQTLIESESRLNGVSSELRDLSEFQELQLNRIVKGTETTFEKFNESLNSIRNGIKLQFGESTQFIEKLTNQFKESQREQAEEIGQFEEFLKETHEKQLNEYKLENVKLKEALNSYRAEQAASQKKLLSNIVASIQNNFDRTNSEYESLVNKFISSNETKKVESEELNQTCITSIQQFNEKNQIHTANLEGAFSEISKQFGKLNTKSSEQISTTLEVNVKLEDELKSTFQSLSNLTETKLLKIHESIGNTAEFHKQKSLEAQNTLNRHKLEVEDLNKSYLEGLERIQSDNNILSDKGTQKSVELKSTLDPLQDRCKRQLTEASDQSTHYLNSYALDNSSPTEVPSEVEFTRDWSLINSNEEVNKFRETNPLPVLNQVGNSNESTMLNTTTLNGSSIIQHGANTTHNTTNNSLLGSFFGSGDGGFKRRRL